MKEIFLIVDDAWELITPEFRKAGIEVIETGPANNAREGMRMVLEKGKEATHILLDMELGEDLEAGAQIFAMMDSTMKAKVIAITGEPLGKQVFSSMGILHTPGKKPSDVLNCIYGDCNCGKARDDKAFLKTSKCDVLITGTSKCLVLTLEKSLSVTMAQVKVVTCTSTEETIKKIQELHPRLVISQGGAIGCAEHDYGHMQITDNSLPNFNEFYGKVVIVGDTEDAKRAKKLEQDFLNQYSASLIVELVETINLSLRSEERLLELQVLASPVFGSYFEKELINIARTMSPSSATKQAKLKDRKMEEPCRWLAVLRRVFGKEKFEEVVARFSTSNYTV